MKITLALLTAIALALPVQAAAVNGFTMNVMSAGRTLPEIYGRGTVYIEALKDRPYELRITNPLPVRVAVALAVDGRNTIDARRSSSWDAAKWVLDPYESTVISGWQVNGDSARLFTFTTEKRSYAAWLGDTSNLGVIEAVFYRENVPPNICRRDARPLPMPVNAPRAEAPPAAGVEGAVEGGVVGGVVGGVIGGVAKSEAKPSAAQRNEAAGDYAATGMGDATAHPVTRVAINLDRTPVAQVRIRYEFHAQLVALGLVPRFDRPPTRREQAHGFENYCPQP